MTRFMRKIPNILTLIRVVLSLFVNIYIVNYFGNMVIPIIIIFIIFLTDFLDGKIARFYGNTAHLGAIFDVLADLFYIVVSYIVLWKLHMLPLWFLFIILFKFMEFVATSYILKKNCNIKSTFTFDFIGRFVAVIFYILPIFSYVSFHLIHDRYSSVINILIYSTTFLIFISASYRIGIVLKAR